MKFRDMPKPPSSPIGPDTVPLKKFRSKQHARKALEYMNEARKRQECCDVVLKVGNSSVSANRQVLSACSPYFNAMFSNTNFAESCQKEIIIREVDEVAMEMLVNFCYTGKINLYGENIQNILHAASVLQIQGIRDACSRLLTETINSTHCLAIRSVAEAYGCTALEKHANIFVKHQFEEITEIDEFLDLSSTDLINIISNDDLNVVAEEKVLKAVIRWVRHQSKERKRVFPQILNSVRLMLCSPESLLETRNDPLVKRHSECENLLAGVLHYQSILLQAKEQAKKKKKGQKSQKKIGLTQSPFDIRSLFSNLEDEAEPILKRSRRNSVRLIEGQNTNQRRPYCDREFLYAIGGWGTKGEGYSTKVDMINPWTAEWKNVEEMRRPRGGVGVAVLDDHIYAVGGYDGSQYLNTVERYNPYTNTWLKDVSPMGEGRSGLGVGVLENSIYAVGGRVGYRDINSVYRYDAGSNRWIKLVPLTKGRNGVGASVMDRCLYAVGGKSGDSIRKTVERYDPRSGNWMSVAPMRRKRFALGCATYEGCLYTVGGWGELKEALSSSEIYDPVANKWTYGPRMNTHRRGLGVGVANNKLYAIGGRNQKSKTLNTVEVYDLKSKDGWQYSKPINYDRFELGVGVVKFKGENCPCLDGSID